MFKFILQKSINTLGKLIPSGFKESTSQIESNLEKSINEENFTPERFFTDIKEALYSKDSTDPIFLGPGAEKDVIDAAVLFYTETSRRIDKKTAILCAYAFLCGHTLQTVFGGPVFYETLELHIYTAVNAPKKYIMMMLGPKIISFLMTAYFMIRNSGPGTTLLTSISLLTMVFGVISLLRVLFRLMKKSKSELNEGIEYLEFATI